MRIVFKIVICIFLVGMNVMGCSSENIFLKSFNFGNKEEQKNDKVEGACGIDISVAIELIEINQANGTIESYFRVRNEIYPEKGPEQGETVKKFVFSNPKVFGIAKKAMLARATSLSKLDLDAARSIIYGTFEITAGEDSEKNFNTLNISGEGSAEMIFRLTLSPKNMPETEKEAFDLLRDYSRDKNLGFLYDVTVEFEDGSLLSTIIEVKIPPAAFKGKLVPAGTFRI